jgi:hypothetical protein
MSAVMAMLKFALSEATAPCAASAPPRSRRRRGARSANETEAEAAQYARKRLGIIMPRDHCAAGDHRWVDAREQQELAVPKRDNRWMEFLRAR